MAKSSSYWDKRAIKRLNEAEQISEEHIERIKKIYEQAYKDIDGEIKRVYKNYAKDTGLDVQKLKELLTRSETKKTWEQMKRQGLDKYIKDNYKSRISRLEQIQAQIYAKAKQIYPKEELENTMCYNGVINNSYYKAVYDTQMGTGYDFSFNKIDKNLTTALLNEKWSGLNYSQRIWGNTDILADSLSQILGGAMLSGQSIEKTTKQIKDRFKVSKYYAERLVRTETNHFNNEADAMAYEEMGIDKYVFVATLDSRTSEMCQSHDNKVYNYKDKEVGVNFPPLHPNCRSKTRGYLGEEAEKLLQRRARNPQTGKTEIIDNISYENWIKQYTQTNRDVQLPTKTVVDTPKRTSKTPRAIKNTDTYARLTNNNVEYKPVSMLDKALTSDKIIEKIAGADKTKGSCVSLGLTYIGNKIGYDVTDFRGGNSCAYFSRNANWRKMLDDIGVKYFKELHTNDFKAISSLLDNTLYDKEYFLITGSHASIIKHTKENGWQYLELQSSKVNGYKPLNNEVLKNRFRCKKSHSVYGNKLESESVLVDIENFKKNNTKFKEILGYINTNVTDQLKGEGGYAK